MPVAVLDSGPILAAFNAKDVDHERCAAVLASRNWELVVPAFCVAEVAYMVERLLGPAVEARFLRAAAGLNIQLPGPGEWERIAELVEQYADFPLGAVDASVVSLAERLGADGVVTLDERHFRPIRPLHCASFRILPADG